MLVSFKAREAKIAIRRGFRERKAPHRCWPERLRDRATDRHSAPNSLGLAAPATGPSEIIVRVKMHRCRLLWLARACVQLSARPLSGRRLRLTTSPSLAAQSHPRQEVPGNHRSLPDGNRQSVPGPASVGSAAAKGMRRGVALLQALAVPSAPARSRQEAFEADSTRAVAGSARQRGHPGVRSRPNR
jgi:hypothetical protein